MSDLVLKVAEFRNLAQWRWILTDQDGQFLGDHEVRLNARCAEYEGFLDLHAYLQRRMTLHFADDQRNIEERQLLDQFGGWLGDNVFGGLGSILLTYAPTTVQVCAPAAAEALALRPLEAAIVGGQSLADAHVTLVHEIEDDPIRPGPPRTAEVLRILAVFSLPPQGSPLNLRRERQALRETVAALRGGGRRAAIELRTLQYGATRETLAAALEDGDGWDILHFSGHGGLGTLALEKGDGTIDVLSAEDLAALLREHRNRLKLVTLSACDSGAGALVAILTSLGLEAEAFGLSTAAPDAPIAPVARTLVRALDCAVVAMRYPVEDQFAIAFADALYRQLLDRRARLPEAYLRALRKAAAHPNVSGLAKITPALFGRHAMTLSVSTTEVAADFALPDTGTFAFPKAPARFVGRVATLTKASKALAADSVAAGVLFHGMAGAGKSACALELADHMQQTRRFKACVWYKAPDRGRDIAGALGELARAFEVQLPALVMTPVIGAEDSLRAWLPRFQALLASHAVLVVLDNLESLITKQGTWRDRSFGAVVEALLNHNGLSRVIFTSQTVPTGLPPTLIVEPIHALPLAEAALLISQPPRLYRFFHGSSDDRAMGRRLLNVVQGHPKLIELAEGLADNAEALDRHVTSAEAAWRASGDPVSSFFGSGESAVAAGGFLDALASWTDRSVASLPEASQRLFEILSVIEPGDRTEWVLLQALPHIFNVARVESAFSEDQLAALAEPLVDRGLIDRRTDGVSGWAIHPAVAARGMARTQPDLRLQIDSVLADFWTSIYDLSQTGETTGRGSWLVRSGLAAVPYLLRLKRWSAARAVLEHTLMRDDSAPTASVALTWFRMIADATVGTAEGLQSEALVARALRGVGRPEESETLALRVLEAAESARQYRVASAVAGDLVNALLTDGRLEDALRMTERKAANSEAGALGPWTGTLDASKRLGVLSAQGKHELVLREVPMLRQRLAALPPPAQSETAVAWNVVETLIDLERSAALHEQQWERALALNAEILARQVARGAKPLQLASTRYNDYQPLVLLERFDEARALIESCRIVFEQEGDIERLAALMAAVASLEHGLRGASAAIGFAERSLRLHYRSGRPVGCALSHYNLANYLMWAKAPPEISVAHHIASIAIALITGSELISTGLIALIVQIMELGTHASAAMPTSFETLRGRVEQGQGINFRHLIESIKTEQTSLDDLITAILAKAFEVAAQHTASN